jgi:hypothetical protein
LLAKTFWTVFEINSMPDLAKKQIGKCVSLKNYVLIFLPFCCALTTNAGGVYIFTLVRLYVRMCDPFGLVV